MDNVIGRIAAQAERYRIAAPFGVFAAFLFFVVSATPVLATPFGIAKTDDLLFGSFVAGIGGTVTIAPSSGARSAIGVTLINSTFRAASFSVSCSADVCTTGSRYTFALPLDNTAALSGPGDSMYLTSFMAYSVGKGNSAEGRLVGDSDTLKVGATLNVGASQIPGSYTGSFSVTVTYQ